MDSTSHRKLIYQYEILRARLEIREHYLTTIVKDIYDNIGQVLSLVRVQLSVLELGLNNDKKEKVNSSGKLVGTVMRELCNIRYKFQPEDNIVSDAGFIEAIRHELKTANPAATFLVGPTIDVFQTSDQGKSLILFNIVLDIISLIYEEADRQLTGLKIDIEKDEIEFLINYKGNGINRGRISKRTGRFKLSVNDRIKLLGGYLRLRNNVNDQNNIKFVIPLNELLWQK